MEFTTNNRVALYNRAKYMKRIFFLFLVLIICLSACGKTGNFQGDLERSQIGVMTTTDYQYNTSIQWFDDTLEETGRINFKYASMGSNFYSPIYQNGKYYVIPKGLSGRSDTKKVVGMDLKDMSIEEYPFTNISLSIAAVIENTVYAINTLNFNSTIEAYDSKTKKSKSIVLEDVYVSSITASDNKLFCFVEDLQENASQKVCLKVYDKDLNLLYNTDVSDCGMTVGKYCEDEENLYFPISADKYDKFVGRLLTVNKKTYDFDVKELKEKFQNDIYLYQDKWIITNFDLVGNEGTKITVLTKDGDETVIDLGTDVSLSALYKDQLIIANDLMICAFSLDDYSLLHKHELETPKTDSNYCYTSALIIRDTP